jgi:hypothetical protein
MYPEFDQSVNQGQPVDLRIPVGTLFTAIGVVLAGYGLAAPHQTGSVQLGVNVNLLWGVLMLLFGAVFVVTGILANRRGTNRSE